jgi:O-succinylbenzoate synthase
VLPVFHVGMSSLIANLPGQAQTQDKSTIQLHPKDMIATPTRDYKRNGLINNCLDNGVSHVKNMEQERVTKKQLGMGAANRNGVLHLDA